MGINKTRRQGKEDERETRQSRKDNKGVEESRAESHYPETPGVENQAGKNHEYEKERSVITIRLKYDNDMKLTQGERGSGLGAFHVK